MSTNDKIEKVKRESKKVRDRKFLMGKAGKGKKVKTGKGKKVKTGKEEKILS